MPTPIAVFVDEDRGFRHWNITEVYQGEAAALVTPTKVHVPNRDDMVTNWDLGVFRVTWVPGIDDSETDPLLMYIPTLQIWDPDKNVSGDDVTNLITGLSGYQPSILNRAFFKSLAGTHTLTFDSRYRMNGLDTANIKVFRGTDITDNGDVISINNAGTSTLVPVVSVPSGTPYFKRPPATKVSIPLNEGERVTVVGYAATGEVLIVTPFIVMHSTAIAPMNSTHKIIADIVMNCDYLSLTLPDTVEIPVGSNINIASDPSTSFTILYTDGSTQAVGLGPSLELHGTESFNSNLSGSSNYLVLKYTPPGGVGLINGNINGDITHTYSIVSTNVDLNDTYKVYLSLSFNSLNNVFTVQPYLTNLNYTLYQKLLPGDYDLFEYDALESNPSDRYKTPNFSRAYNLSKGQMRLNISVKMDLVLPDLFPGEYRLTQMIDLDLNDVAPSDSSWILDYRLTNANMFNGNKKFVTHFSLDYEDLDLSCGIANQAAWLTALYSNVDPLKVDALPSPPEPTHFRLEYDIINEPVFTSADLPISSWNITYVPPVMGPAVQWKDKTGVRVVWLREETIGDIKKILAMTPVMIAASYS